MPSSTDVIRRRRQGKRAENGVWDPRLREPEPPEDEALFPGFGVLSPEGAEVLELSDFREDFFRDGCAVGSEELSEAPFLPPERHKRKR